MPRWRMLYIDPGLLSGQLTNEVPHDTGFARPAMHDPLLAGRFARLFAGTNPIVPDALATEKNPLRRRPARQPRYDRA